MFLFKSKFMHIVKEQKSKYRTDKKQVSENCYVPVRPIGYCDLRTYPCSFAFLIFYSYFVSVVIPTE